MRLLVLADHPFLKPLIDISKLADVARRMVKSAIDAFVKHNNNLAKEVILSYKEADNLRNKFLSQILHLKSITT